MADWGMTVDSGREFLLVRKGLPRKDGLPEHKWESVKGEMAE